MICGSHGERILLNKESHKLIAYFKKWSEISMWGEQALAITVKSMATSGVDGFMVEIEACKRENRRKAAWCKRQVLFPFCKKGLQKTFMGHLERSKNWRQGIPREEIVFIHEANTETKKAELFAKVRAGQVRILIGSTPKLGAGTNVQDRLIALHHLDCPWKPSDLEQQEGRILRQGNRNEKVKIFRYVTEGTFDAYMW